MFCVFCLPNTGFVQCYSLGSHKVCCTLVLYFALFSNFLFCVLCLSNIGIVQCFTFGSRKVTRFCYALVRNLFCVFCLTNTGFVQCHSLGSRKVCCTLVFNLFYSVIFVLRALPHKHRDCAVLSPRLPYSLLHEWLCLFCFIQ